jgi:ribosomal protein L37AE/L43A
MKRRINQSEFMPDPLACPDCHNTQFTLMVDQPQLTIWVCNACFSAILGRNATGENKPLFKGSHKASKNK